MLDKYKLNFHKAIIGAAPCGKEIIEETADRLNIKAFRQGRYIRSRNLTDVLLREKRKDVAMSHYRTHSFCKRLLTVKNLKKMFC